MTCTVAVDAISHLNVVQEFIISLSLFPTGSILGVFLSMTSTLSSLRIVITSYSYTVRRLIKAFLIIYQKSFLEYTGIF